MIQFEKNQSYFAFTYVSEEISKKDLFTELSSKFKIDTLGAKPNETWRIVTANACVNIYTHKDTFAYI